jgi:hypothetical protein
MVVSILVYGEMMVNYQIYYIYIWYPPQSSTVFWVKFGRRLERGYNVNYTDEERITYCAYGEILPSALANVCKRLKEIGIEN